MRTRLAWFIRDAGFALADKLDEASQHAEDHVRHHMTPVLRGRFSRLAGKVMPCGCRPTDVPAFCDRKRPPLPGGYFQRNCDCACHEKGAAK